LGRGIKGVGLFGEGDHHRVQITRSVFRGWGFLGRVTLQISVQGVRLKYLSKIDS